AWGMATHPPRERRRPSVGHPRVPHRGGAAGGGHLMVRYLLAGVFALPLPPPLRSPACATMTRSYVRTVGTASKPPTAPSFLFSARRASSHDRSPSSLLPPGRPLARDLGYHGPPFAWDEDRRAQLRAELDAFYARAYRVTREELRYILDPADVKGPSYPS